MLETAAGVYRRCPVGVSCFHDQITHLHNPGPSSPWAPSVPRLLGAAKCPPRPRPRKLQEGIALPLAPLAGSPDRSPPRVGLAWLPAPVLPPLTAAAPPGGRRRPQQRAVNLFQPLQVFLPARAGLASHLLHRGHHGVEIVLQGVAGAGLSGRSVRAWLPAQHPAPQPSSDAKSTGARTAQPGTGLPLEEQGRERPGGASPRRRLRPTAGPPLLSPHSCWQMLPAPVGPFCLGHSGLGRQLVPSNVGNSDRQGRPLAPISLEHHQA